MKPKVIGAFEAKTHLSQLLDDVESGSEIEITRRGKPVARLVPVQEPLNEDTLQRLVQRVREERGVYKVRSKDIEQWKQEGRR
jgi:prevent-host-death family protein